MSDKIELEYIGLYILKTINNDNIIADLFIEYHEVDEETTISLYHLKNPKLMKEMITGTNVHIGLFDYAPFNNNDFIVMGSDSFLTSYPPTDELHNLYVKTVDKEVNYHTDNDLDYSLCNSIGSSSLN